MTKREILEIVHDSRIMSDLWILRELAITDCKDESAIDKYISHITEILKEKKSENLGSKRFLLSEIAKEKGLNYAESLKGCRMSVILHEYKMLESKGEEK